MIIEPKIRGFLCTTAHPVGCRASVEEQIRHYRDPAFRQRFRDEQKTHGVLFQGQWDLVTISGVDKPENQKLMGMNIAELAKTRNKDPVDLILDLALDEAVSRLAVGIGNRHAPRVVDEDAEEVLLRDGGLEHERRSRKAHEEDGDERDAQSDEQRLLARRVVGRDRTIRDERGRGHGCK